MDHKFDDTQKIPRLPASPGKESEHKDDGGVSVVKVAETLKPLEEVPMLPGVCDTLPAPKSRLVIVRRGVETVLGQVEPKPPKIDNTWTIERVAREVPPAGWEAVFKEAAEELKNISDLLVKDEPTYGHFVPDTADVFKAFELTPLSNVRVVIFGQDPYHTIQDNGHPIAEGLSFSVPYGTRVPPSLNNIYKAIRRSYPDFQMPSHGCLHNWARKGVLMLNACLTTRAGAAGAHSKYMLWMPFILKVLAAIHKANPNCVYVMWGKEAQKLQRYIEGKKILIGPHPSPINRGGTEFVECGHFRKINDMLGTNPIDWQV